MAHKIYVKPMKGICHRCQGTEARISTYHMRATYQAECSTCGFGRVTGDNEEMAMARLYGEILKRGGN